MDDKLMKQLKENWSRMEEVEDLSSATDVQLLRKILIISKTIKNKESDARKLRGFKKDLAFKSLEPMIDEKMNLINWIKENKPELLPALKVTLDTGKIDRDLLGNTKTMESIGDDTYDADAVKRIFSLVWYREMSADEGFESKEIPLFSEELNDKLHEVFKQVWNREISADEGFDEFEEIAEE